jgi:hypothetical protein
MAWTYGQQIWTGLSIEIKNKYGIAGLMGNLVAESGLIPFRYQGDFSTNYENSIAYTNEVDTGSIPESDFVIGGPNGGGYGLAQWTYYTRKQALFNMKKAMCVSIGDVNLGINYLLYELKNNYPTVLTTLKKATSIRQASDSVLHNFERPSDQSLAVEKYRASLGQSVYNEYHNSIPLPNVKSNKMPLWMMVSR